MNLNYIVEDEQGNRLTYIRCRSIGENNSETKQYIDTQTNKVVTTSDKGLPYIWFELLSILTKTYGDGISLSLD